MPLFILNISLLMMVIPPALSAIFLSPMTIIKREGAVGICPSQGKKDAALENIRASVRNLTMGYQATINCGPGRWYQVASLNMSDPSQQCPSAWREYNASGVRACGRPVTSDGSCSGAASSVAHRQYSRVCGRAIGYQFGSPDAFG